MKDITEYLKKAKVELIGFDIYNEEECLKAIKSSLFCIKYIENPTEEMQLIAIEGNGGFIKHVNNPSEKVIIEAVRQDRRYIQYVNIESLSEETKELLVYLA